MTTAISAILGAVCSALLGALITWVFFRWRLQEETREYVGDLYDKLVEYRRQHPEVLTLSRLWQPDCLRRVYRQKGDEDRAWAIYYGYVELLLGYCTYVLGSRGHALGGRAYEQHHRGLVKLLLAEHYPAVRDLTQSSEYVSPVIASFLAEQETGGWDWTQQHELLELVPSERPSRRGNRLPG